MDFVFFEGYEKDLSVVIRVADSDKTLMADSFFEAHFFKITCFNGLFG